MVSETWLAPVSETNEVMMINPPEVPVTPGEGNKVMNLVALGQLPRYLRRHGESRPLSRPGG